jgi:hypothetical protein
MSSITTWQRLEPLPRSDDLRPGLRAEIADPLWLLARQRQFGELRGEDAGSPIQARFEAMSGRISRVHLGPPDNDEAATAVDHDDRQLPLEVVVEREPVRTTPVGGGLAVGGGLHFARLLRANGAASRVAAYLTRYALRAQGLPGDDEATAQLRRRAVGQAIDGRRLTADLLARRGTAAELTSLPAQPAIPAGDRPKVLAAANAFLRHWEGLLAEPAEAAPSAWVARRLEHAFAVQADLPSGRVVLRADDYRGGRLDWYAFTAAGGPDLGPPTTARAADHTVRTVMPAPAGYGGMPASRFWEIEDGSVRFGALTTGRTDLARLILAEFALAYGTDWFVVPIDLPVGSVCSVDAFEVTDTFGETATVARSVKDSGAPWRLFELAAPNGPARVAQLFFLAPTLAEIAESDPVEEVALIRDEMANLVWGVERRYQGGTGGAVDRYAEHQQRLATAQRIETDIGDAQLIYRLATDVPYHWFPFVPVRPAGAPALQGVIQLERRPLVRVLAGGATETPEPRGRVLVHEDPLRLEENEVDRNGTDVVRTYQLARWIDGRYLAWSGRHRKVGAGEGSSGLRFDSVAPAVR